MQHLLPFAELRPSDLNPRKRARSEQGLADLAQSIATHGVLQNLIVRNTPTGFEIVAGEGRYRGVEKMIADGLAPADFQLPVKVIDCNDEQAIEIALIENLQRENLHPLDEAEAFAKLYDLKAASGGKKAGAQAVKFLAEKLHCSTRYVQKRIKIARDLIPEWTQLLEEGVLALNIAQLLCAMPMAAQLEKLAECRHWQRDDVDLDRVRDLSAAQDFAGSWRPLAGALFDVALYHGETEEVDGETFATYVKAFDALQKPAAAAFTKDMRAKAKAGDIAFFDELRHFSAHNYEQHGGEGAPDPAAGVALVKEHSGEFIVYRGLAKTKDLIAREERKKAADAAEAKRAKRAKETPARGTKMSKAKPDARIEQVRAFAAKDARTRLALALFNDMSSHNDGISWIDHDFDGARKTLEKAYGGKRPAGAKLLAWLLEQKAATLTQFIIDDATAIDVSAASLIKEPSEAELVLFDHCGATLAEAAPPKTNAKPKTASKSKPSKKKAKKS